MSFDTSNSTWERTTLDDVNVYKQFKLTERLLNLNEEIENIIAYKSSNRYSESPRDELEMCDSLRTAMKVFLMSIEPLLKKDRSTLDVNYWTGPLVLGAIPLQEFSSTNLEEYLNVDKNFVLTSLSQIVVLPDPIIGLRYTSQKTIGKPIETFPETVEIAIPWEVLLRSWRHIKYWCDAVGLSLDLDVQQDWKASRKGADYYEKAMKGHTWNIPQNEVE